MHCKTVVVVVVLFLLLLLLLLLLLQERNAVAVQSWLWDDNKVPYVIDTSAFCNIFNLLLLFV